MAIHLSQSEARRILQRNKQAYQAVKKVQESKLRLETAAHLSGLPVWVTEHRFHPTRRWRFDYAWPDQKIALEVHGGVHSGGRHNRGVGLTQDREKMNTAACMGWVVIEATAEQVRNGQARAWLDSLFSR